NIRVDFDFRRGELPIDANDGDTRFHFAVARVGDSLNNSDFRAFEIRILNNGGLIVNSMSGSSTVGTHLTAATNHLTILANSHDTSSVAYSDGTLGSGSLAPNTLKVFLNNTDLGTFTFHQTPDPANAPQVDFYAQNDDLGQFAFYQDTSRQGELVVDNLSVTSLTEVPASLNPPSSLAGNATGPATIVLTWQDNADNELSYTVERKSGSGNFTPVAEVGAGVTTYTDASLSDNTMYTYRVKARAGVVSSDPSNEVIVTTPEQILPLLTGITAPSTVATGETATVTATAIGRGPLSYQWYQGASGNVTSPISSGTSATLTLPNLTSSISVWVRVSNGSGQADSATQAITTRVPGSVIVRTASELDAALSSTGPGDVILLANGTWDDAVIRLTGQGTDANPITVGAETPGKVILTGDSRAQIGGYRTILRDLIFTGTYTGNDDEIIQFRNGSGDKASYATVSNVSIIDYVPADGSDTDWVSFYGTNNRLTQSYLSGHSVPGVTVVVEVDEEFDHHEIDHNHFANRIFGGENGWETIRVGVSDTSMQESHTVVEHNLFTRVDGEIEIISNKSGSNFYRYNTFLDCSGTLTLRHGNACHVEGNLFLGRGRSGSGGVRVIGTDHRVVNNHFEDTRGRDGAAITVYAGVSGGALNEYFAAHRAYIAHNTFVNVVGTLIDIGTGIGSRDRTILPEDVVVANNVMANGSSGFVNVASGASPTWTNNLFHNGVIGLPSNTGFVAGDPLIRFDPIRLHSVPSTGSAVIDAAVAVADQVSISLDLRGNARDTSPDLGALEFSRMTDTPAFPIATTASTGPSYLNSNRTIGTPDASLVNSSVRALSGSGDAILINGFVVGGSDLKSILVRTVGPGLTAFGVSDVMAQPAVKIFNSLSAEIASNSGWENGDATATGSVSALVGAFPLVAGSADSAVVATVPPGAYTAQVSPVDGQGGTVLVEVYDATPGSGFLLNQSARGEITANQPVLIAGFAVSGTAPRRALIRCVGPELANFGVTAALSDPELKLFDASSVEISSNDNWSSNSNAALITTASADLGAFPLTEGSDDAAVLVELSPGSYTVHARGISGAVGTVLLEVYFLTD
ncbi:MAG: hypothetical protein HOH58_14245, partial [Opitutaceae bacterium]|nr:hypothetical protein [Opitutaceae bacterium]